jgi:hypothetical protein
MRLSWEFSRKVGQRNDIRGVRQGACLAADGRGLVRRILTSPHPDGGWSGLWPPATNVFGDSQQQHNDEAKLVK